MTVGEFQTLYKYYLELLIWFKLDDSQPAFTFSKLIIGCEIFSKLTIRTQERLCRPLNLLEMSK